MPTDLQNLTLPIELPVTDSSDGVISFLQQKLHEWQEAYRELQAKYVEGAQHVYNHYDSNGGSFNFKIEKNTKGFNYEISIQNCRSREEAQQLLAEADGLVKSYIQTQSAPIEG